MGGEGAKCKNAWHCGHAGKIPGEMCVFSRMPQSAKWHSGGDLSNEEPEPLCIAFSGAVSERAIWNERMRGGVGGVAKKAGNRVVFQQKPAGGVGGVAKETGNRLTFQPRTSGGVGGVSGEL
jgi:hypothetical protein